MALLLGLMGVVVLPGCAWVRAQAQQRSDECERLCSQASQARESGRVEQADRLLDRALRKSPRDLEVQRQLAVSLWEVGRHREALSQMTRLADEHPLDVRLSLTLAEWHQELGRYEDALERLQPALATEPASIHALELKARIETERGDDDAALSTWQRLSQQEASQADALVQMGAIYLNRGQPNRAAPLFRSVITHPRASAIQIAEAKWQLGVAYAQTERWTDAATQLADVAPLREMTADDWHAIAFAQFRAADLTAAHASLNHALLLEPRHPAAHELAAALLQDDSQRLGSSDALLPAGFERVQPPQRSSPR